MQVLWHTRDCSITVVQFLDNGGQIKSTVTPLGENSFSFLVLALLFLRYDLLVGFGYFWSTALCCWKRLSEVTLDQWFLTGGINKFPGGREPLRALQHGKFDQWIYQQIHFVFTTYVLSGGAWNKRQSLKGGVLEKMLRATALDEYNGTKKVMTKIPPSTKEDVETSSAKKKKTFQGST